MRIGDTESYNASRLGGLETGTVGVGDVSDVLIGQFWSMSVRDLLIALADAQGLVVAAPGNKVQVGKARLQVFIDQVRSTLQNPDIAAALDNADQTLRNGAIVEIVHQGQAPGAVIAAILVAKIGCAAACSDTWSNSIRTASSD